jgi:dynein heavy chain
MLTRKKKPYSELELIILLLFQIPRDAKHKLVYIAKKITESIGGNDFSQTVFFGELPAPCLRHVCGFLDEVAVYL